MNGTEWMGRYRMLVQLLTQNANQSVGFAKQSGKRPNTNGCACPQEWQVLEYIIEHEEDEDNMRQISDMLGIPKSSLTKYTKHLCELGFLRRYRTDDNKKNIILRATDEGKAHYAAVAEKMMRPLFDRFFEDLDCIPQEYLDLFVEALRKHNIRRAMPPEVRKLVPLDQPDGV